MNHPSIEVVVVRFNSETTERRVVERIIKERVRRHHSNGAIDETLMQRSVPRLYANEIEIITVDGQSTIVQVGR